MVNVACPVRATSYAVDIPHTPTGPEALVTESTRLPNLARRVGPRLAVPVFRHLAPLAGPADTADRSRDFAFAEAYRRVDSLRVVLPQGHRLTAVPAAAELSAPHARYRLRAERLPDGSLLAVRELELRRGVFPASEAPAIAAFYRDVRRADGGIVATAPRTEGPEDP